MSDDDTFRIVLLAGMLIVLPIAAWHRVRSATGEKLDRRQEGLFILLTLRPLGLAMIAGLIAYIVVRARWRGRRFRFRSGCAGPAWRSARSPARC